MTIALGVGANTAIYSLMDAVLLKMLPVQYPKDLVFLSTAGSDRPGGPPPYPCFVRLRDETTSFAGMAAFASDDLRVEVDGQQEQVMGQTVSGSYFQVLGLRATAGRLLEPEDEGLNPPVAVISDRYWRRRFGRDQNALGKSISFRGRAYTIVGVTPPEFKGLQPGAFGCHVPDQR